MLVAFFAVWEQRGGHRVRVGLGHGNGLISSEGGRFFGGMFCGLILWLTEFAH